MSYLEITLEKCPDKPEVLVKYTYTEVQDTIDTPGYTELEIDEITTSEDILSIFAWYKSYGDLVGYCKEKVIDYEENRDGYDIDLKFGED